MSTNIPDPQKIDFLLKKVGYELAKTDLSSQKTADNETIASPIIVGSKNIWLDPIPTGKHISSAAVQPFFLQLVPDGTSQPGRAWIEGVGVTNKGNWISQAYGNYGISCFSGAINNPNYNASTHSGIQPNPGAFFIDYAAGVINFAGTGIYSPQNLNSLGAAIYVSGFRYVGAKGSDDTNGIPRKSSDLTQFSNTSASGLRSKINEVTGSGALVFQSGAYLTSPAVTGNAVFYNDVSISGNLNLKGSQITFDQSTINSLYISATSGNFQNLTVNNVPVSVQGHVHTTGEIVNFIASVQDVIGSGNGATGFLRNGSGLAWTYDDGNNTLSVRVTGIDTSLINNFASTVSGLFNGQFNDNLNASLIQGTGIGLLYNTGTEELTISVTGIPSSLITNFATSTNSLINSSISGNIVGGSGIQVSYNPNNSQLTVNSNISGVSGIKVDHSNNRYTISLSDPSIQAADITDFAEKIVSTTGNQTVSGVKTFTDIPVFSGSYSNGQLFIGSGTALVRNTLTQGDGVSISNAAGSITIGLDNTSVRTSGTQSINGSKTFNNNITFGSGLLSSGILSVQASGAVSSPTDLAVFSSSPTGTSQQVLSRSLSNIKSDLGLNNVTNDAQVKKISSSTNGNIPIWNGTTGDLLGNGYSVETTSLTGSSTAIPRADVVKTYVDTAITNGIATNDAMIFRGSIPCAANPNYPAADRGWTYKVSSAGKIGGPSGPTVEVNDTLICTEDGTAAGDHATVGDKWVILQTNIVDSNILVTGPTSATSGNLVMFSGTTGRAIQDTGFLASDVVLRSGDQTISGVKTFSSGIVALRSSDFYLNHSVTNFNNAQINNNFRVHYGTEANQLVSFSLIPSGVTAGGTTRLISNTSGNNDIFLPARGQNGTLALLSDIYNGTLSLSVSGTGLSGSASFSANQDGNATFTVTSNATPENLTGTIVARNSLGDFSARLITANGFSGSGNLLTNITASNITGTIPLSNLPVASTTASGISRFDANDFDVTNGVVSIKTSGIDNSQLSYDFIKLGTVIQTLGSSYSGLAGLSSISGTSLASPTTLTFCVIDGGTP